MKKDNQILTSDLRDSLKQIMQKELMQLLEILQKLEPEQRINMLIKLMPFIMPKVAEVSHEQGEPDEFTIKPYS
jgi:hypothetical protein